MQSEPDFWKVSFGNVLTIVSLLGSFWAAHIQNQRSMRDAAAELAELKTKMEMVYRWFEHNVVGRGEVPRRGAPAHGAPAHGAHGAHEPGEGDV